VKNITGQKIGILRGDEGAEYKSAELDKFLAGVGIRHEHPIRDTPQ